MTGAMGAQKGLYGNYIEEAWYSGFIGDGSKPSMLRFAPGKLRPENQERTSAVEAERHA